MTLSRISTGLLTDQSVSRLQNNLSILSQLQEKLSSGKNINKPSDDPLGLTRILDLANVLELDDRYKRNISAAQDETAVTDTTLDKITDIITRSRELATQGANITTGTSGRRALASEVDQLLDQVLQLGNTKVGQKYIFSGLKTDTAPFARVGNNVTFNGTPPGEATARDIEIGPGVSVTINLNGQSVFGTVSTNIGPPETIATGTGLVRTLTELKLNLLQDDITQARARLADLDVDLQSITTNQATIGATTNRLDLSLNRIEDRKASFTKQYASIQDIDTPSVISQLQSQENIFQASLGVTAKVLQPSLLDFLR